MTLCFLPEQFLCLFNTDIFSFYFKQIEKAFDEILKFDNLAIKKLMEAVFVELFLR